MRRLTRLGSCLLAAAVVVACSEQSPPLTEVETPTAGDALFNRGAAHANVPAAKNFVAPMDPGQEVHAVNSRATGNTVFHLRDDGLHYKVIVANIQNVTMAHIHCGIRGMNGPVVVWLYPSSPPASLIPGRTQGILADGVITAADVRSAPNSSACPGGVANFDDLLSKMRAGDAYVNVHTSQYGAGEIRGQIFPAGPADPAVERGKR